MLEELTITNLATIENSDIEFTSNYISLVGETGAGKSLIITALNLLLGGKGDKSLLREEDKPLVITGVFSYVNEAASDEVFPYLMDDRIIIKRKVTKNSSTTYINGNIVTLSECKNLFRALVDIHSQGENSLLLNSEKQLSYLDKFAKDELNDLLKQYQDTYHDYLESKKELNRVKEDNRFIDLDYLNYQIQEIEKYHLKDNEIEELEEEYKAMHDYEKIEEAYTEIQKTVNNGDISLFDILASLRKEMRDLENSSLKNEVSSCLQSLEEFEDHFSELDNHYQSLDFDKGRLDYINSRLYSLKSLQMKYGKTTKEILDALAGFKAKIDQADHYQMIVEELDKKINNLKSEALRLAKSISIIRKKKAIELAQMISFEMKDLALEADFLIDFNECELNSNGIDEISFLVRLNPGLPYQEIKKAISGGENSRLMLSLKVVLNKISPTPTIIFDEIDTGVSGRIATLMARKILAISSLSQVIVISHLPQVVASSKESLLVKKVVISDKTLTTVSKLDEEAFISEVAKMLSSSEVTESSIDQAKNLIREYR